MNGENVMRRRYWRESGGKAEISEGSRVLNEIS